MRRLGREYWEDAAGSPRSDLDVARDVRLPLSAGARAAYDRYEAAMARFCWVGASGRALDAGCGPGNLYARGRDAAGPVRYVGLDFVHALLLRARLKAPEGRYCQGDVRLLPFRDGSLDRVVLVGVLPGLGSHAAIRAALEETARVLSRGGVVVVDAVPNSYGVLFLLSPARLRAAAAWGLEAVTGRPFYQDHAFKVRGVAAHWVRRELLALGFSEVARHGWNRPFHRLRLVGRLTEWVLGRLARCLGQDRGAYLYNRVFFHCRKS